MKIKSLGYLGLQGPDPKRWLDFATQVCGLMAARSVPGTPMRPPGAPGASDDPGPAIAADGTVYLKLDDWQWRIAVHPDERPGLRYVGFELADAGALASAAEELERAGVAVTRASDEERSGRGVLGLVSFADPAGNRVELFQGATRDRAFQSPQGVSRVVTGALGMGHVVLLVPDLQQALDFYCCLLGFQLSDFVRFGPSQGVWFLRCNARHHSLALVSVAPVSALHHFLIEFGDIDDVGCALDRAMAGGHPITSSLGRHANDRMFSFYMKSPFGFDVELGTGGRLVDESWTPNEFVEGDVWGHKGLTAEALEKSGT
jgi:3,4-dihydroxy-9,10-secoandrosta-1,3,5(10)-triene-9,17-dione 4,5-dioxygenase